MLNEILQLYKSKYQFDKFYDNIFYNISHWQEYHIENQLFLMQYPWPIRNIEFEPQKPAFLNNIRVDLPVWFGNLKSEKKVIVVGLEPRNTDAINGYLNIEHKDNYVFATPFALERPKGVYHKAFKPITENPVVFSYFTDVVKEYLVLSEDNKKINDLNARRVFWEKAEQSKCFLKAELDIIRPSAIIALGKESFLFLKKYFDNDYHIEHFRHPSYGGSKICKEQMEKIIIETARNK